MSNKSEEDENIINKLLYKFKKAIEDFLTEIQEANI